MMKISFIIPSAAGGGVEKLAVALCNHFAQLGHQTDLLIGRLEGPNLEHIADNVKIVNLKAMKMRNAFFSIRSYVKNHQPDIIISGMHHTSLVTELALTGLSRKPPHIGSVHNMLRQNDKIITSPRHLRSRLSYLFERHLFSRLSHLLAVSNGVHAQYKALFNLPTQKMSVIYNPINIDAILKSANEDPQHKWFNADHPVVLAVGRLTPQKAFDFLLRSFQTVHLKTGAKLIILGEGELRNELEQLRSSLGLDDAVDLPGYTLNPYAFMARSDLFVLSSTHEGLGIVLLESLALGLPIVSTDCPSGPAEIIGNNEWGLLTPVGDTNALSRAIITSLESKHNYESLRERAELFDISSIGGEYLQLMESLTNYYS